MSGEDGEPSVLGAADYAVLGAVLLVSSAVGLYFRCTGGKQATLKEYMLADRNMSIVPVAFSLMASFMSAITLLGVVEEMYMYGTQFIMINISYIIATPIVCYFYLPVFFRLQKTSVYEYLELRFGYPTRLLASLAFSLQMTLYMGIVLYAPALALSAVTELSQPISIVVVGCVCTFYSALGGMKAVLITDLLQSLLMFAAIAIVLVSGLQRFTPSQVFNIAADSGRLEFFITDPDPRTRCTLWTQAIGGIFTYLSLYGVNQAQVQRLLTIRSLRKSQAAVWLHWPILMVLSFSTAFAGLIIYAHYKDCDPLLSGVIDKSDQLLPLYVVQFGGGIPGVTGLFIAGVFSGSLSTVSSSLNSLAAVTISDYIEPVRQWLQPGRKAILSPLFSPLICLMFGAVCVGIAFLTAQMGSGVLQAALTVFGAVGGPLLGLFTLGMTTKMANQKGALTGLIFGLFLSLWIGFGQPKPDPIYKPQSTDGCNATFSSSSTMDAFTDTTPELPALQSALTRLNLHERLSDPKSPQGVFEVPSAVLGQQARGVGLILKGKESVLPREVREWRRGGRSPSYLPDRSTTSEEWSTTDGVTDGGGGGEFNFLHEMYAISYAWVGAIGFFSTYLVGVAVSAVFACCGTTSPVSRALLSSCCGGRDVKEEQGEEEVVLRRRDQPQPRRGPPPRHAASGATNQAFVMSLGKDARSNEIVLNVRR